MQITAVIVTYADRFNLLKQVISACFKNGVSNIVVVDNNSHKNSKNQLKALLEKNKDKIAVVWNTTNLGSAKAYKQGLQEVKSKDNYDYIWLLDDDNKPKEKALELSTILQMTRLLWVSSVELCRLKTTKCLSVHGKQPAIKQAKK